MGIFKSKEKKVGNSELTPRDVALSLDDARLQEDLEDMVEQQKAEAEKEAIKKQLDDAELKHLAKQVEAELTDTSEAHLYLRAARELISEKNKEFSYQEVIKIAIAYVRIGEVQEALKLIDELDLPTEKYLRRVDWIKEVYNFNPFSEFSTKEKKHSTKLAKWKFKDFNEHTYVHNPYRGRWSISVGGATKESALIGAIQNTQSFHERQFKSQLGLSEVENMTELQGMSPKEYVLAIIAYYSNWIGGVSTKENVKKFASTLKYPEKDFSLASKDGVVSPNFSQEYSMLSAYYENNGPAVLGQIAKDGFYFTEDPKSKLKTKAKTKISKPVLISFLCDLAIKKYKENPHDVIDDKDKEIVGV